MLSVLQGHLYHFAINMLSFFLLGCALTISHKCLYKHFDKKTIIKLSAKGDINMIHHSHTTSIIFFNDDKEHSYKSQDT